MYRDVVVYSRKPGSGFSRMLKYLEVGCFVDFEGPNRGVHTREVKTFNNKAVVTKETKYGKTVLLKSRTVSLKDVIAVLHREEVQIKQVSLWEENIENNV